MNKYRLFATTNKGKIGYLELNHFRFKNRVQLLLTLFRYIFLEDTSNFVAVFGSEKFKNYIHDLLISSDVKNWECK